MTTFLTVPIEPTAEVQSALDSHGIVVVRRDAWGIGHSVDGAHQMLAMSPTLPQQVAKARAAGARAWAVVQSPQEVHEAIRAGADVWLRGQEAGGFVGDATALVLIRAAADAGAPWIAEGLGERASAACLALGADGVVLDGPLWACQGQWPLTGVRSGRDTGVLGESAGYRLRVLTRGNPAAIGLATVDETALRDAVAKGDVHGAPQSVGLCEPYRNQDLVKSAQTLLRRIQERSHLSSNALRDDPFGTGRAVVQGPMANVTEAPELSQAVAAAGALPFCALGALVPDAATTVLNAFDALPAWGAGVIGFDVMPFRDAHLTAVAAKGPRPVILAGGSVALAQRVAQMGLEPWLHTPDRAFLDAALQASLPAVILEGHEAGGHVGSLTSLGLWEEALVAIEAHDQPLLVVLAGGIGDAISAAVAGSMTSKAHSDGTRVALQAGTAFLFTHEIVEAGQIPLSYQEAALAAETTELVGATVNLPLRCVPNDYTDEARDLEMRWATEGKSRTQRRESMEAHNLGRARMAAKGIERHPEWGIDPNVPHYRSVDPAIQRAHGALTMGQGATVTQRLCSVAEVVDALSTLAADRLDGRRAMGAIRTVPGGPAARAQGAASNRQRQEGIEPIAVVGMGCVLPGAAGVSAFWDMLLRGTDAVGAIPAERWLDARYAGADRSQSTARHAGVVRDFVFDPLAFRIPPKAVPAIDRAQQLALVAAKQAVEAAGWDRPGVIDRRRAAVILGNSMGGEHAKSLAVRIRFREVMHALSQDASTADWSDEALDALEGRIEARLAAHLPPVDVESMAGLLGNVIAGRVASWLDWMGGNLTVDAACAASLGAVSVAVDWLRNGRVDAVLTGGVDADMSPETYVGFSRTLALSSTGSSPFSGAADGFVMGEGAAVLALMRLSDAVARDVPVWGVIHGVGQASDGRSKGITAPRAEGQELAMARAYAEAGVGPDQVGAIEAHGTGTALGDRTEAGALARRLAGVGPTWLGSVKSNIGHLKGAAGAAGLVKAVLTSLTGVVPPTLHGGPILDGFGGLQLPRRPAPLLRPLVGVSAFGFGGTDFHVLVGPPTGRRAAWPTPSAHSEMWGDDGTPVVSCFAAGDLTTLAGMVEQDLPCATTAHGAHRLALCVRGERLKSLKQAAAWLRSNPEAGAQLGRDAFYGTGDAEPIVLLFPGQGAQRVGAVDAATQCLPGQQATDALGSPLGTSLRAWEAQDGALAIHLALFASGIAWNAVIQDVGLPVAATVGHSLGAFPSLVAAGRLTVDDACNMVVARGQALEACPEGAMLAVNLDVTSASAAAKAHGLWVAAANGPHATVLAGPVARIESAQAALAESRPQRVPVPRAYHTPSVQSAADALLPVAREAGWLPGLPVWSTRTALPFGHDLPVDLAKAIVDPVRFDDTVVAMLDAGHKLFVECGPGSILSRLVRGRGGIAIPLDARSGGLAEACAALWAQGHPQLLDAAPGTVLRRGLPAVAPWSWPRPSGIEASSPTRREAKVTPVASAPEPMGASNPPAVHQAVIDAICEVTGYPEDFVSGAADLEADLGVDSIRKMEVLGHLEKALGIRATEADHGRLAETDVQGLVAWVQEAQQRVEAPVVEAIESVVHLSIPVRIAPPSKAPLIVPDGSAAQVLSWLQEHGAAMGGRSLQSENPAVQALVDGWAVCARAEGVDISIPSVSLRTIEPVHHDSALTQPVVLATGGLDGIVVPCLDALADLSPIVLVLGRRDRSPPVGWHYRMCDLTNATQVNAVVAGIVEEFGPIDVVVHGAGALADGPWNERSDADRERVLGPKVEGALHLQAALSKVQIPPKLWINFGSVVAFAGNTHQSLYAAANRALAALPLQADRVLTIGWTAWSGVGMAKDPVLQRLLATRGLRSVDPTQGADAFRRLVDSDLHGDVLVWGQEPEGAEQPPPPLTQRRNWTSSGATWSVFLDPASPALADHIVAGRPLVPAAWWAAAMLRGAEDRFGACHRRLANFTIHAPTFVSVPRDDVVVRIDVDRVEILAGSTIVASARLALAEAPEQHAPPQPLGDRASAPPYHADKLFHGHAWQVLQHTLTQADHAYADVRAANGLPRHAELMDGAYQLLCTWADDEHGFLALPTGAEGWSCFRAAEGPVRLVAHPRLHGNRVVSDVLAIDETGAVAMLGRGVALQRATKVVP